MSKMMWKEEFTPTKSKNSPGPKTNLLEKKAINNLLILNKLKIS